MILTGNEIGQRLRELRFKSGFTQEAVAKALCYTRSTYAGKGTALSAAHCVHPLKMI